VLTCVILSVASIGAAALSLVVQLEWLPNQEVRDSLTWLGEIAATLLATVLAVVTFAILLRAPTAADGVALAPLVATRHHMFFVCAYWAAITTCNVVMPLSAAVWPDGAGEVLLAIDAVAVPVGLAATIWMVCAVIADINQSTFESVFNVLEAMILGEWRDAESQNTAKSCAERALTEVAFEQDQYGGKSLINGATVAVAHQGPTDAIVVDLDRYALSRLRRYVESKYPDMRVYVTVAPAQRVGRSDIVRLAPTNGAGRHVLGRSRTQPQPVPPEDPLSTLSHMALIVRREGPNTSAVLSRVRMHLEQRLVDSARRGAHWEIDERFAAVEQLLTCRMQCDSSTGGSAGLGRDYELLTTGHIRYGQVVRGALQSGDSETVKSVIGGMLGLLSEALRTKRVADYQHLCGAVGHAYGRCVESPPLQDTAREVIDAALYSLLGRFQESAFSPFSHEREECDGVTLQLSACTAGLGLGVLKSALDHGLFAHAEQFMERLCGGRDDDWSMRGTRLRELPRAESPDTLEIAAIFVGLAWCVRGLDRGTVGDVEAAKSFLQRFSQAIPWRHCLVGTWELYFEDRLDAARHSAALLGFSSWGRWENMEYRPGYPVTGSGESDWLLRGMCACLLLTQPAPTHVLDAYFAQPAPRHMWSADAVCAILDSLYEKPWLPIPDGHRRGRRDEVVDLVRARQSSADQAHLRVLSTAPLSQPRVERLRNEIVTHVRKASKWPIALREIGVTSDGVSRSRALRLTREIPRGLVAEVEEQYGGYGEDIAERWAMHNAVQVLGATERAMAASLHASAPGEILELVREAKRLLAERVKDGQADVLLVPSGRRMREAIFGERWWMRGDAGTLGRMDWGVCEGLRVLALPHSNAVAAIVAKASQLFRMEDDGECEIVTVEVRDRRSEAGCPAALDGSQADETPDDGTAPQATVVLTGFGFASVRSTDAAVAIDVSACLKT